MTNNYDFSDPLRATSHTMTQADDKNNQSSNKRNQSSDENTQNSVENLPNSVENIPNSVENSTGKSQSARKYITLPGGKRKWVRVLPRKKRGKDKKPRKRGEEHGNWKHGFGKSRPYDTEKYAAWKEAVLRRGKYCCLVTNQTTNLTCHHLNSWDWCEEQRYDSANGVVLSEEIHKKFHSIYGHGENTREQFEHFLLTHYNLTLSNEQYGDHEPSLTTEYVQKDLEIKTTKKKNALIDLITSRNHELRSGTYVNAKSVILVYCKKHDCFHETTVTNYKKSKTGMPCCGKERQSQATAYNNTLR